MFFRPLLHVFLITILLTSNVVFAEQSDDLRAILSDPDKTYEEKREAYFEFVAKKNPQMATVLESPGGREMMEKGFKSMLDSMAMMKVEPAQPANPDAERDAAYAQYMKNAQAKQAAVNAAKPKLTGTAQILAKWPTSGVTSDVRSRYEVKGIAPGDQLVERAGGLMDQGYSYRSMKSGRTIDFERVKTLKDDIVLSEYLGLTGYPGAPDVVTGAVYVVESKIRNSRTAVPIESLTLTTLKQKLQDKYGPPLTYDEAMEASIYSAENAYKKAYQEIIDSTDVATRCDKNPDLSHLPEARRLKVAEDNYKSCLQQMPITRKRLLERHGKFNPLSVKYTPCADKETETRKFGGCISQIAPMAYSQTSKTVKDSGGSAFFGERCYAWVEDGESLTLCAVVNRDTAYRISVNSRKVSDWMAVAVKDNVSEEKLKVDLDL